MAGIVKLTETPLDLLRLGYNTMDIAGMLCIDEATAYNAIHREKNNELGLSFNPAIFKKVPYVGKGAR
jgi:hypothetical protein